MSISTGSSQIFTGPVSDAGADGSSRRTLVLTFAEDWVDVDVAVMNCSGMGVAE